MEWKGQDIGKVGKAGSATVSDVTITARVASLDNVHEWVKAGLMIRESLDPDARHAMIAVTPGNGVSLVSRTKAGGESRWQRSSGKAPYWIRLQRDGNNFTGYASADRQKWTTVGSVTIPMASAAYVGPALTSHRNDTIGTAKFDSVTVEE